MDTSFYFHENLLLRTPRLPFGLAVDQELLKSYLADDSFMEAVYLASPALFHQCRLYQQGQLTEHKRIEKLFHSLGKYLLRMSYRSTPFGLFSGCSVVPWGTLPQPVVLAHDVRRTRLDMKFLCDLARTLAALPEVQAGLKYFPNSSIYQVAEEQRYTECHYVYGLKNYQLTSVRNSTYLELVLQTAQAGANRATLAQALVACADVTEPEAADFITEIIDNQILISELEPKVTGDEFVQQILQTLTTVQVTHPSAKVEEALLHLKVVIVLVEELDLTTGANNQSQYATLIDHIRKLGVSFSENQLFQTDVTRTVASGALGKAIQQEVLEAVEVLAYICPDNFGKNLRKFATSFTARYDTQEIPLLEVLDPEIGIGYGDAKAQHATSFISSLNALSDSAAAGTSIAWTAHQRWLFARLQDAQRRQAYTVEITTNEVQELKSGLELFPVSTSVTFRLLAHEQLQVQLEGVGGASAANLLSRFAHASPAVSETIVAIKAAECVNNPQVEFCEVVHLSESRVGNILLHPNYHTYEIPYLAQSSRPLSQQILPADILVSVIDGQVILKSKKLNKLIIPQQTSAHNHTYKTLPVYQFLCDIQSQELRVSNYFNWGSLAREFTFLPRLVFKSTVLYPATWQFKAGDLKELATAPTIDEVAAFRAKWQLPQYVMLIDGDNELVIDFHQPYSIQILLAEIKSSTTIILREYLVPAGDTLVKDTSGVMFCNQFIASLIHKKQVYQQPISNRFVSKGEIQREFGIGSEWLYYKIYCNANSIDKVLTSLVFTTATQLLGEDLIDKWFFLRFNDPEAHLRVRFHVKDSRTATDRIATIIREGLTQQNLHKAIWKIQGDTYSRELERYGSQNIELYESVSYHDSVAFINFYRSISGPKKESLRWLYLLESIDSLLDDFKFTLAEKCQITLSLSSSLMQSYQVGKAEKLNLDKAYREYRPLMASLFADQELNKGYENQEFQEILAQRSANITPCLVQLRQQNTVPQFLSLVSSFVHMVVNRAAPAYTGKHELVAYTYLHKYYQSIIAVQAKSLTINYASPALT
jgi:thiopeptide-type bacteriocin biosynthesis protein